MSCRKTNCAKGDSITKAEPLRAREVKYCAQLPRSSISALTEFDRCYMILRHLWFLPHYVCVTPHPFVLFLDVGCIASGNPQCCTILDPSLRLLTLIQNGAINSSSWPTPSRHLKIL